MDTRPTADRLRETLFNVLTQGAVDRIEGARFLDLYAGSGVVGIEALSRGAVQAVFVEQAAGALAVLRKNLDALGIRGDAARVEKRGVGRFLRGELENKLEKMAAKGFGVVFLDPPYDLADEYAMTLGLLGGEGAALLAPDGLVVAEHRRKQSLAESYGRLTRVRLLEQGDAGLSLYEIGAEA
jgi:16S rRNA (guanine(966)-N(2))-methyltransferase RsmD